MSLFGIFSRKNPFEVHIQECLKKASPDVLIPFLALSSSANTAYDESRDLPRLSEFFSRDDPGLICTVATVPESCWKFFRELISDGGKILTLSMKNPNAFETAMNAMETLAYLPYFTCEAPEPDLDQAKEDELPELTFRFAIAEEVRSTFNRHLKAMDRDYAAWTNLWKLACALVKFQGVCTFDNFIDLARTRFRLPLPEQFIDAAGPVHSQICSLVTMRGKFEKSELNALSDAFVLPKLENSRGIADNIRQRRAAEFSSSPTNLTSFARFATEHALNDADIHLEDSSGHAVNTQTIGRNDLCPCGSGKKFKKCCGR